MRLATSTTLPMIDINFGRLKTERAAAVTVLALKELFELAFEKYNTEVEKAQTGVSKPASPVVTTPSTETVVPPPVSHAWKRES